MKGATLSPIHVVYRAIFVRFQLLLIDALPFVATANLGALSTSVVLDHFKISMLVGVVLWVVVWVVYDRFFSPLRNVPGPALARLTRLWECLLTSGRGPVVRIGPNRYIFNTPEAMKTIYAPGGGFRKSDWYSVGGDNLFSMRDEKRHATRRRKVAQLYTMSTMVNYEGAVDEVNSLLTSKLDEMVKDEASVRLPTWLQYYAFDVIGKITVDKTFDLLHQGRDTTGVLRLIRSGLNYQMMMGLFPELHPWVAKLTSLVPGKVSGFNMGQFLSKQISNFRALELDPKENPMSEVFVSKLSRLEREGKIDLESINDACGANVAAGSDTTAISLSSAFYYIYRQEHVLQKLRAEIDEKANIGAISDPITFHESQGMPYLQATIKEILRVHPAVGQMLARTVPENGVNLEGYHFPPKTQVGVNAWALHYNSKVFDNPESFSPERWLSESEETGLQAFSGLNFAFGSGSRVCIGKNVSLLEMHKLIPQVVRNYDIHFDGQQKSWTTDSGWFVWPLYQCRIARRK
ncbi:hypothetical protein FSPOR_6446 [Fusarium sporotrichioides]|uniref:Pisatin demethylase n=1 Tax=Fusarium sporotrichioides TaxID=5514 RepID=A0A395S2T0_FUSSP|nr:hypothetical protein FSPOR_6446 [Fusarium sporotrichioides]